MIKSQKSFIFTILFALLIPFAHAQRIKGMAILGGNISQIDGDEVFGYKRLGVNTGFGVLAPLDKTGTWQLSMEVLFSQRGARENGDPYPYDCRLNYIDVPLMMHLYDARGGWTFGLGLQYGRLLSIDEHLNLPNPAIKSMERPLEPLPQFRYDDYALVAGVRFKIWEKLKMDIRFQYSLTPIRKEVVFTNGYQKFDSGNRPIAGYKEWKRDMRNNWITLRLVYIFNERSDRQKDKNIDRETF